MKITKTFHYEVWSRDLIYTRKRPYRECDGKFEFLKDARQVIKMYGLKFKEEGKELFIVKAVNLPKSNKYGNQHKSNSICT
jgi:hypothetical protein